MPSAWQARGQLRAACYEGICCLVGKVLLSIVHFKKSTSSKQEWATSKFWGLEGGGWVHSQTLLRGFQPLSPSHVLGSAPDIFIHGLGISIVDQPWMSIQTTLELYNSVDCIRFLIYLVMSALPLQEKDLFECCKWDPTPSQLAFICLLTMLNFWQSLW